MTARRLLFASLLFFLLLPRPASPDDGPGPDIVLRKRTSAGAGAAAVGSDGPGGEPPGMPSLGTLSDRNLLLPLLGASFSAIGENFSSSGTLSFPDTGGGQQTVLESSTFPLVALSSGRTLILDIGGHLDSEAAGNIERDWEGYRVVSTPRQGDLRHLLGDIFAESGFHRVSRDTPLTLGRAGEVSLHPDFLVIKKPEDVLEGSLYLVTIHEDLRDSLPVQLRDLAAEHRIRIIEIHPAGGSVAAADSSQGEHWSAERKFTASDPRLLLQEIAPFLGIDVVENPELFVQGESRALLQDRRTVLLTRGGRLCLVTFRKDTASCDGVRARALACLVGGGLPFTELLGKVLRSLEIDHSGPALEFFLPGGRFTVDVPGFYLPGGEEPVLVTGQDLGGHISSLMEDSGVNVITWALVAPGR